MESQTVIMVSSSVKSSFSHSYLALICQRQKNDLAKMETGAQKSELPKDNLQRFKILFRKDDPQHPTTWMSQELKGFAMLINLPSCLQEREEPGTTQTHLQGQPHSIAVLLQWVQLQCLPEVAASG